MLPCGVCSRLRRGPFLPRPEPPPPTPNRRTHVGADSPSGGSAAGRAGADSLGKRCSGRAQALVPVSFRSWAVDGLLCARWLWPISGHRIGPPGAATPGVAHHSPQIIRVHEGPGGSLLLSSSHRTAHSPLLCPCVCLPVALSSLGARHGPGEEHWGAPPAAPALGQPLLLVVVGWITPGRVARRCLGCLC